MRMEVLFREKHIGFRAKQEKGGSLGYEFEFLRGRIKSRLLFRFLTCFDFYAESAGMFAIESFLDRVNQRTGA